MNLLTYLPTPRPGARFTFKPGTDFAATDAQAARLAALRTAPAKPPASRGAGGRLWDHALLDRLASPLSRVRE